MNSSYQDLLVWQKAMDLVEETYGLVRKLPKEETYALSDQMRRAAVSIPSNIAEGKDRVTDKEFIRFLSIARGSASELETQFIICSRLNYLAAEETNTAVEHCREVGRMLHGLIKSLEPQA